MILDFTVEEMVTMSRVATIAIEQSLPTILMDPDIDPKAFLSAAEKLHRAATAFVARVSAPGIA